jgi:hypothetical protein
MNLKKNLLALSVGTVIAAASTAASANSLLFPYFNFDSSGNMSFMSLETSNSVSTGSKNIHWVYFGAPTGGTYTADSFCAHQQDGYGTMTPNDMVNMMVSANPATPTDTTSGNMYGDKSSTFSLTLPAAAGFVVVSDVTTPGTPGTTTNAQALTGEMIVVNANPNVVFGYSALTNANAVEGDFSNIDAKSYTLSWYPNSAMTTQWYALAVGNQSAAIGTNQDWSASATTNVSYVYDRDETALSQNVSATVGCGTTLSLTEPADATGQQIVSPANQVAITNGGMAPVSFTPGAGTTGVVMFKVETPKFLNNANAFFTLMRNTDGTGSLGF